MTNKQPNFAHKRPAPRKAGGWGKPVTDDITWTRILSPRERYRITYEKDSGERSERDIELSKIGHTTLGSEQMPYLGVMDGGRFKTLRADRVIAVTQISEGHEPSIVAYPTYATMLPAFPPISAGFIFRVPTIAASRRTWKVDLRTYTCTCPEGRIRAAKGYKLGQLGAVCLHLAHAILDNLPTEAKHLATEMLHNETRTEGCVKWKPELLSFLGNRRRMHIDNLTQFAA